MTAAKKERNSSIELLRILALMGVVLLHYNNEGIGNAFGTVTSSNSAFILNIVESFAICAVDLFMIISGYFLCNTYKRSLSKIVFLLMEASLLSGIAYIVLTIVNHEPIKKRALLASLLSIGYFLILYSVTYIVSPIINYCIEKMTVKNIRKFVLILFILFSVYTILIDVLSSKEFLRKTDWYYMSSISSSGSGDGYTVVNFLMCYTIGALLRNCEIKMKRKSILLASYIVVSILITLWYYCFGWTSWNYNNPLVIISAVLLFLVFANMNFKSKIINELSRASFTCYLINSKLLIYVFN